MAFPTYWRFSHLSLWFCALLTPKQHLDRKLLYRVTQQAKCVSVRDLLTLTEINSSSSARVMTERDGLELERRRLLAIIRTRKSLQLAFSIHVDPIVSVRICQSWVNWLFYQNSAATNVRRIEDSAGQKMYSKCLGSIKIYYGLLIGFACVFAKTDRLQNPQFLFKID